jgi:hypothetical protein
VAYNDLALCLFLRFDSLRGRRLRRVSDRSFHLGLTCLSLGRVVKDSGRAWLAACSEDSSRSMENFAYRLVTYYKIVASLMEIEVDGIQLIIHSREVESPFLVFRVLELD